MSETRIDPTAAPTPVVPVPAFPLPPAVSPTGVAIIPPAAAPFIALAAAIAWAVVIATPESSPIHKCALGLSGVLTVLTGLTPGLRKQP